MYAGDDDSSKADESATSAQQIDVDMNESNDNVYGHENTDHTTQTETRNGLQEEQSTNGNMQTEHETFGMYSGESHMLPRGHSMEGSSMDDQDGSPPSYSQDGSPQGRISESTVSERVAEIVQSVSEYAGLMSSPEDKNDMSGDDYKFKKPLLPPVKKGRNSKAFLTEEEKRIRDYEDSIRVQKHLEEATRKSQEAAAQQAIKLKPIPARTRPPVSRVATIPRPPISIPPRRQFAPVTISASAVAQVNALPKREAPTTQVVIQKPAYDTQMAVFQGEPLKLPNLLVYSEFIFRYTVSKHAFRQLSAESQEHLKKLLPPSAIEDEEEANLNCAFSMDKTLLHGNTIDNLQGKLQMGWYDPNRMSEFIQIRDSNRVLYDHYIRNYHMSMFQKLLMSRKLIFDQYDEASEKSINTLRFQVPKNRIVEGQLQQTMKMKRRAAKRSRMMINDCRSKVGDMGMSSDEDDDANPSIPKALMSSSSQRSTIYNNKLKDLDLYQPLQCDDVKTMLKKYKQLRRKDPHAPSLRIKGIKLDDVYERAGVLAQAEKIRQTVAQLEKELKDE